MNNKKVSIIIPTFNRGNIISETIQSVVNQTYQNWECIIIDDGSSDNTDSVIAEFLKEHKNINYFKRNRLPKGVSTCRNIGLEKASGEFLIFLDSDDLLGENCLKSRVDFALKNSSYDFWVFQMQQFEILLDNKTHIKNNFTLNNSSDEYLQLFLKGTNAFHLTCPLWKKESLTKSRKFNEELELWEDPEFHIGLILSGLNLKVSKNSKPDCYYRIDLKLKMNLFNDAVFLKKLYRAKYIFYNEVAKQLKINNFKNSRNKNLLLFNMISFIQKYVIEKKNNKQFIRYYFLLIWHGLINFKKGVVLISWFLFAILDIDKVGRWSVNSLRKRMYYLISNS